MNSLPFISHHLFVAAIGNEGRAHERPTRHERPAVRVVAPASIIALEVMADRKLWSTGADRLWRASVAQVRG